MVVGLLLPSAHALECDISYAQIHSCTLLFPYGQNWSVRWNILFYLVHMQLQFFLIHCDLLKLYLQLPTEFLDLRDTGVRTTVSFLWQSIEIQPLETRIPKSPRVAERVWSQHAWLCLIWLAGYYHLCRQSIRWRWQERNVFLRGNYKKNEALICDAISVLFSLNDTIRCSFVWLWRTYSVTCLKCRSKWIHWNILIFQLLMLKARQRVKPQNYLTYQQMPASGLHCVGLSPKSNKHPALTPDIIRDGLLCTCCHLYEPHPTFSLISQEVWLAWPGKRQTQLVPLQWLLSLHFYPWFEKTKRYLWLH